MRWTKPTLLFLIVFLFLTIQIAVATIWHFPKPRIIPDDGKKWHFGNEWVSTTGSTMKITKYFVNDWFNYTASGGTQQVYRGTKPFQIYFNDVEQNEGEKWNYANGITTITPTGTNVSVLWGPQTFDVQTAYATSYLVYGENIVFLFDNGSSLCFQNKVTKTVTLDIETGLLNTSQNSLRIYTGGGYFRFIANNYTSIVISHNGVDNVKISGDQNNTLRHVESGSTYSINQGNNVLIQWDITLDPLFPLMFTLGISGLAAMFAGPAYAIYKIKEGHYLTAFSTGVLVTTLGVALFMAWLWGT